MRYIGGTTRWCPACAASKTSAITWPAADRAWRRRHRVRERPSRTCCVAQHNPRGWSEAGPGLSSAIDIERAFAGYGMSVPRQKSQMSGRLLHRVWALVSISSGPPAGRCRRALVLQTDSTSVLERSNAKSGTLSQRILDGVDLLLDRLGDGLAVDALHRAGADHPEALLCCIGGFNHE